MVPVLLHFLETGVFARLTNVPMEFFIEVGVDVAESIHTLLLFIKVVFELSIVLGQIIVLILEFTETILNLAVLQFRLLDGFLDFSSFSNFTFFDFFC